ncbi:uncharacterized protein JCM6883_005722 [Sporobolomyces salmoneus]|uniref:uncharacterized protein n=1 Tax=Sporobolomyces salmoneus TaxID=183962 RepID=UPI003178A6AC
MDIDPSIYFHPSSPDPASSSPPPPAPSTTLPHVTLPTLPRPSVSPASTRVSFTQQHKSGRTSARLDLSASMEQNNASPRGVGSNDSLEDSGADSVELRGRERVSSSQRGIPGRPKSRSETPRPRCLTPSVPSQEVARARADRAARRNLALSSQPTSPSTSSPSSFDARDSASARDNILNLVSAGQSQISGPGGGESSTPSLAMFMGGGQKRRIHKVNQEMTEQEREVTEKLEREMEQTRAKWGNKSTISQEDDNAPSRGGGMSLASLMNRQVGGSSHSQSVSDEPKRWQPSTVSPPSSSSEPPIRAQTAPAASSAPSTSNVPRSLASAFGSTATGPRLNSSSQTPTDESEGSAHARSGGGGYAMPGLAKPKETESEKEVKPFRQKEEPSLVEAKTFSRPAPDRTPSNEPAPSSPTKIAFPSISNNDAVSKPPAQNSTLGRLRGTSIVAERLKFAEQLQQQSQSPISSPTKERGSTTTSPEKRRSVLERWGRDQPNVGGSNPTSPTKSSATSLPTPLKSPGFVAGSNSPWSTSTTGKPISTSPKEDESKQLVSNREEEVAKKSSYSKPSWEHAPIGVKPTSTANRHVEEETTIERKHTRGVALPGLGSSSTPPSPTKPIPSSSSGGVRAAAMKWGRTDSDAQREKLEELKRLKESYGVKVDSSEPRRPVVEKSIPPPSKREEQSKESIESKPVQPAKSTIQSSVQPPQPQKKSSSPPSSNPLVNEIVSLAMTSSPSPRLSGEVLSLDVFHLNSPTDNPHPIEHNHMLHSTEILGIVARTSSNTPEDVETHVWVWRGKEAEETAKTEERIAKLEKKTGVQVVRLAHRQESRALVEAFEGQLTVCKGLREEFDHLEKRLLVVSSSEEVVFVEETDFTAKSLCSGYSAVLSLPGEVYAWLGEGSNSIEREACCQFAESIADGRSLSVLAEGEESQWFWHSLDEEDNIEYSSANYWHRRFEDSPPTSLIRISSSSATRVSSIDSGSIHLLDGGSLENVVLVPESARNDKTTIKTALEAARTLSSKWQERGFESKTPSHVLVFPSLVPRDLPFLARSIDFDLLNGGTEPRKMNVYTLEEAEKELL